MRARASPLEACMITYICKVDVMKVVLANHITDAEEPYAIRVRALQWQGSRWILQRVADVVSLDNVILPFDLDADMSCSQDDVVLDEIVILRRCARIGPVSTFSLRVAVTVVAT